MTYRRRTHSERSGALILDVPLRDVHAHALSLKLGQFSDEPALASKTLKRADHLIELSIIGASHRVEVRRSDDMVESESLKEELSCAPGSDTAGGTPIHRGLTLVEEYKGWNYRAQVRSLHLDRPSFLDCARDLARHTGDEWLVAEFPGEGEGHITALHVPGFVPNGIADGGAQGIEWSSTLMWQTWHLYAKEQVVVRSNSRVGLILSERQGEQRAGCGYE